MTKKATPLNKRSDHMRKLAQRSNASRIKRNITAEIVVEEGASAPYRKRKSDAGYDVASMIDVRIRPHESVEIPTGLRVKCPTGYFYKIEPRSSLLQKNLVKVAPVIDATYTGPLFVKYQNVGKQAVTIKKGDRIAQLVFYPQFQVDFKVLTEFPEVDDERGDDGYGSTGK